ncbi:MAG: pyruvate ferredoxin oxidoreductase [bacterium]|nr:pyruvate ferredoxin oxidoreductase [bacterium]
MKVKALTGNEAAVEALRQINPDIFAMFPITPSTQIPELFDELIAQKKVDTVMIRTESEHSAISAAHGAALAGARVVDATASQGIALKHEILYITAGSRLPVVMLVANRALSAPLNIHADHSDTMGSRDAGWLHLYSETVQEVYDTVIQAFRIAEHKNVLLPIIIGFDGFTVSHAVSRVEVLEDDEVKNFVGKYVPEHSVLDTEHPATFGLFALPDYYMEYRRQVRQGMCEAKNVIISVGQEFGKKFGRNYGLVDNYKMEDADVAAIVIGSTSATLKDTVDELREKGIRAGVLRVRSFRPFPSAELRQALMYVKAVAVLDRADSPGTPGGPLFADICSALYGMHVQPVLVPNIYGLGGRELMPDDAMSLFKMLLETVKNGKPPNEELFIAVRKKGSVL